MQFKLDGANLGIEDSSAPYSVSWDTRLIANGSHTLTAVARDAAGNTTTSGCRVRHRQQLRRVAEPRGRVRIRRGKRLDGGGLVRRRATTARSPARPGQRSGKFGAALSFDGGDVVNVPDSSSLDLTTAMTLEAWVRPTALGTSWRTVVFKEQPGYYAYSLYASTGTGVPSGNAMIAGTDRDVRAASALTANTWTHLAATYDGAALRIYVNGVQSAQLLAVGSIATSTRRAEDRRQQHLARGLPGIDRRGADLQPRTVAGRDPGGYERERRQSRHPASDGSDRPRRDRLTQLRRALVDCRDGQHRSRPLQRAPLDVPRLHRVCREPDRPADGTSYTDAGLAAGTYYYRVIAEDAAGNASPSSNEASATVTGDVVAPTGPASLTATASPGSVALSWPAATDNVAVTRYNVHRSTSAGFTPTAANRIAQPTGTTYTDPGLAAGTYYYRVIAEDAAGNLGAASPQASATVTTAPPTGLVAAYSFDQGSGTVLTRSLRQRQQRRDQRRRRGSGPASTAARSPSTASTTSSTSPTRTASISRPR